MEISIIIPIYNVEKYLENCIDSIIDQMNGLEENIEIILVDDGSTDNSGKICDGYVDKYENLMVVHKKNGGLSDARNAGILKSSGKYLMFIDSDDWIADGCIERILHILKSYADVDIVVGKFIHYYEENGTYTPEKYDFDNKHAEQKTAVEVLTYIMGEQNCTFWSACRSIFRKELFTNNNIMFECGIIAEDLECIPKIFLASKKIYLYDEPFYYYRRGRKGSIINSLSIKKMKDIEYAIKKNIDLLSGEEQDREFVKAFYSRLGEVLISDLPGICQLVKDEKAQAIDMISRNQNLLAYTTGSKNRVKVMLIKAFGLKGFCFILSSKYKLMNMKSIIKTRSI